MGKHSIRGVRSGNILNVAGKDDPKKVKKHSKPDPLLFTVEGTSDNEWSRPAPAHTSDPPVYEGWMDHWDPMADLERILEQDRQKRKRQAGY